MRNAETKMEEYCRYSAVFGALDRLTEYILKAVAFLYGKCEKALDGSRIVSFARTSALLRFDVLLCGFFLLMFLIPHSLWTNTWAVLAAVIFIAAYFIRTAFGKCSIVSPKSFGVSLTVFFIMCFICCIYSCERADSLRVALFFTAAFIFLWITRSYISSEKRLEIMLMCIYAVVLISAAAAIGQRVLGIEADLSMIDTDYNPGIPARVFSTVENPNNYAELLVLFSPAAFVYAMTRKAKKSRAVLCLLMLLPMAALLMTYSRSGWLSMALCMLAFVYFSDKRLVPALLILGVAAIPFMPASIATRLSNMFNRADTSAGFRLILWRASLKLLSMDNRWLTGIGLGASAFIKNAAIVLPESYTKSMPHTQMLYLELVMEWGIMGFVSYMCFIISKLKCAVVSLFRTDNFILKESIIACVSSFAGIAVLSVFEYIWFYPRILFAYFILLGIMLGCIDMVRKNNE